MRLSENALGESGRPAPTVIALHCSGADSSQWRTLRNALEGMAALHAPNLIGSGDRGAWIGCRAFSLMDEIEPIVDMIDDCTGPIHLVGHSYGGAVALRTAQLRSSRIAGVSVYEPSLFGLLRHLGAAAEDETQEIEQLATVVSEGLLSGAYEPAACHFVEYWSGPGSWAMLRAPTRAAMLRWLPKAALDFRALLGDGVDMSSFRNLNCPVLLVTGDSSPAPSLRIADELEKNLPNVRRRVVLGAGHMGPLTHSEHVAHLIRSHVAASEQALLRS